VVVALTLVLVPSAPGGDVADATTVRAADAVGRRVLVAGDSVAFNLSYWHPQGVLGDIPATYADATVLGCGVPVPDDSLCDEVFDRWRLSVERFDPDVTVLGLGRWELQDRVIGGRAFPVGEPRTAKILAEAFDHGLDVLTKGGGRVALLNVPTCFPTPGAESRYSTEDAAWLNDLLATAAAKHAPDVQLLDYDAFVCPSGPGTEVGPVEMAADGVHLTEPGSYTVWDWLARQPFVAGK
jgi:hypothetical protein